MGKVSHCELDNRGSKMLMQTGLAADSDDLLVDRLPSLIGSLFRKLPSGNFRVTEQYVLVGLFRLPARLPPLTEPFRTYAVLVFPQTL